MRHAILILAHKDLTALKRLTMYFSKDCDVYIHIDKKLKGVQDEVQALKMLPMVKCVSRRYNVNWGGFNMLLAELELLEKSCQHGGYGYYHLLSGTDYPLKPLWYFLDFFSNATSTNYVRCKPMLMEHFQDRLLHFHPYDFLRCRERARRISKRLSCLQDKLGVSRSIGCLPRHMYIGSQWFSITDEAVKSLLQEVRVSNKFLMRMKYTFAPEEMFVNTMVMNGVGKVIPDNLRYIRWTNENGNCPANLDLSHLKYCLASGALFARKIDGLVGESLKSFLEENIVNLPLDMMSASNMRQWADAFFDYDATVAEMVRDVAHILGVSSVLYPECGSCLYLDALIGMKVPVLGISSSELSEKLAKAFSLDEFFQLAGINEVIECGEPFGMTLFINVSQLCKKCDVSLLVGNINKLTEKYVMLIERKVSIDSHGERNATVDSLGDIGFVRLAYLGEVCKIGYGLSYDVEIFERRNTKTTKQKQ